jgi:hypothetical protein
MSETDPSPDILGDLPEVRPTPKRRWTWARFAPLLSKVALELFIVFVGVSAAFAVDNYRDARQQDERRQAVYRALDRELTQMAVTYGPAFQREMTRELTDWDRAIAAGTRPLPPTFRMPRAERPPTGVWDAAVATGSIELIDADLFYELARFYNRAKSIGDLYQRYVTPAEMNVWPRLEEGAKAFWEPTGDLRPEIKAHVMRLRIFRERQGQLDQEAGLMRAKLRRVAAS